MPRRILRGILLCAVLLSPATTAMADPGLRVALTFDDLPLAGQRQDREHAEAATGGILKALASHGTTALGLVTTQNVFVEGQVDFRLDLLREWLEAGMPLGNHSHSHRSFQEVSLQEFQDDFVKGDLVPRMLMAEYGRTPRYYRHPFNHTGRTVEDKRAFERFMAKRGYRIVPFTVEHSDYAFNKVYVNALRKGDEELAAMTGAAYLEQLDAAMDFAERLTRETFGRDIPQILLLHANELNGRYLGEMLDSLAARGYRFVTPEEARPIPPTPHGTSTSARPASPGCTAGAGSWS